MIRLNCTCADRLYGGNQTRTPTPYVLAHCTFCKCTEGHNISVTTHRLGFFCIAFFYLSSFPPLTGCMLVPLRWKRLMRFGINATPILHIDPKYDEMTWFHTAAQIPPQPNNLTKTFEATCRLLMIARRIMDVM